MEKNLNVSTKVLNPNEKIDIVIRPEDLEITSVEKGKMNVKVDTQLFRGVHYELIHL